MVPKSCGAACNGGNGCVGEGLWRRGVWQCWLRGGACNSFQECDAQARLLQGSCGRVEGRGSFQPYSGLGERRGEISTMCAGTIRPPEPLFFHFGSRILSLSGGVVWRWTEVFRKWLDKKEAFSPARVQSAVMFLRCERRLAFTTLVLWSCTELRPIAVSVRAARAWYFLRILVHV